MLEVVGLMETSVMVVAAIKTKKKHYFLMKQILKHTVQGGGGPLDPDAEERGPEKCGNVGRED